MTIAKPNVKKTTQLRTLLHSPHTEILLEAHNGASAIIAEQSGADGIWGSGLAVSMQYGVRDNNEVSWTQVVDMLEFMSDVTQIPILMDGDTGYGNFNNVRRLIKKLEQRYIAGVCIEDKEFPKTNSFIQGNRQPLADIDEFCGKIMAGKDTQQDEDFCIVARVEALIAGWDMSEALRRAERYHQAGADAILIHSKASQAHEVLEFAREWAGRSPLVIVPTTYYSTPIEVFEKAGISLVIWANHLIRSCISSMRRTAESIVTHRSSKDVEESIAAVKELFSLQGMDELAVAEERYLSSIRTDASGIILAASRGNALQSLTENMPKVMLPIGGRSLLRRLVHIFKKQQINKVTLVAGYKAETIAQENIDVIINDDYATTNELVSLQMAQASFSDITMISYGDLLIREYILRDLVAAEGDIVAVVDSALDSTDSSSSKDYAWCDKTDNRSIFRQQVHLQQIARDRSSQSAPPCGRWIGLLKICGKGRVLFEQALDELAQQNNFTELTLPDLFNHLIDAGHTVNVHYINGHWLDINTMEDLQLASTFSGISYD